MKALLDTHVFLWWIMDDPQLSDRSRELITNRNNIFFLSAASGWEIMIKARLGRLQLPKNPQRFISEQLSLNNIESLPVQMSHALHTITLPDHHRDPFDRILIAQAQLEKLAILSADPQIIKYEVKVIW
jgi:PIN domain nuclease of toxin-antitoxin system